ncbi:MAG: hypothetical protein HLUCCX10_11675 [Algoriphagus marincola HL-49]|uniref:Uncharacterized protein n=1 Tax=Algoriphagus marincola HL-49 TaxID=1305737 RepID=A0A0P8A824_9BACT|nr:MAG: hypothetical protein HLUCCX10_11675 [Algoriphagus marincola HL-49]
MKPIEKLKSSKNPIYFSSPRTEALEEALRVFLEVFEEYGNKYELTEKQISSFKSLIMDSYVERRATFFLEDKFSSFNDYLFKSFQFALNEPFEEIEKEKNTNLFYYNKKHKLISNKQY